MRLNNKCTESGRHRLPLVACGWQCPSTLVPPVPNASPGLEVFALELLLRPGGVGKGHGAGATAVRRLRGVATHDDSGSAASRAACRDRQNSRLRRLCPKLKKRALSAARAAGELVSPRIADRKVHMRSRDPAGPQCRRHVASSDDDPPNHR